MLADDQTTAEQPEQIHQRIRRLMEEHGFSQRALADKANIDRAELNRIVNNKRDPTIEHIARIASGLELQVEDLLRDVQTPAALQEQADLVADLVRQVMEAATNARQAEARAQASEAASSEALALVASLRQQVTELSGERDQLRLRLASCSGQLSTARAEVQQLQGQAAAQPFVAIGAAVLGGLAGYAIRDSDG